MSDEKLSILLVEGIADEYFIREFCSKRGINLKFEIKCCGWYRQT